jgi:hypothetical protein
MKTKFIVTSLITQGFAEQLVSLQNEDAEIIIKLKNPKYFNTISKGEEVDFAAPIVKPSKKEKAKEKAAPIVKPAKKEKAKGKEKQLVPPGDPAIPPVEPTVPTADTTPTE